MARQRERIIATRGQPAGALHSRTIENSNAAAKSANANLRERMSIG